MSTKLVGGFEKNGLLRGNNSPLEVVLKVDFYGGITNSAERIALIYKPKR